MIPFSAKTARWISDRSIERLTNKTMRMVFGKIFEIAFGGHVGFTICNFEDAVKPKVIAEKLRNRGYYAECTDDGTGVHIQWDSSKDMKWNEAHDQLIPVSEKPKEPKESVANE